MPRRSSRAVAGAVVAALAAALLSACSGSAAGSGGCSPAVGTGTGAAAVTASGAFGSKPDVSFATPLHVTTTQATAAIPGSGAPIRGDQLVVADLTLLDGTTGAVAVASEYAGDTAARRFVVDKLPLPGLAKALVCARAGERLIAVIPPAQGIPAASRPESVGAEDSLVAVVDVRRAFPSRADGADQVMGSGLPAVVLGADGRPGITLPEGDPPTALQVADLKKGSGPEIRRGDDVVVQYTGVIWKPDDPSNGTVFDSSWADGTPRVLRVQSGQIVPGLVTALTGQRVGSQVLAILPPKAYGSQASSTVPAGSTLVFVVDVLGKA